MLAPTIRQGSPVVAAWVMSTAAPSSAKQVAAKCERVLIRSSVTWTLPSLLRARVVVPLTR